MKAFILSIPVLLLFIAACKSSGHHEVINNSDTTAASLAAIDSVTPKLVKSAQVEMKVRNVAQSTDRVAQLANAFHGTVTHSQFRVEQMRTEDMRLSADSVMRVAVIHTYANISVNVPTDSLFNFIIHVRQIGVQINNLQVHIEDKSLDFLSSQLKLQSGNQIIAQQHAGKIKIKDPAAVIQLKDDLIDQKINTMRITNAIQKSTVDMVLYQNDTVIKENIANVNTADYRPPFFKRLGFALSNSFALFGDFIIGLLNLWLFILAAIIFWLLYKQYAKKRLLQSSARCQMQ